MIEAGRFEEAIPFLKEAKYKLTDSVGKNDSWVCKVDANLRIAYTSLGNEV